MYFEETREEEEQMWMKIVRRKEVVSDERKQWANLSEGETHGGTLRGRRGNEAQ